MVSPQKARHNNFLLVFRILAIESDDISGQLKQSGLWLVESHYVTRILASHWSRISDQLKGPSTSIIRCFRQKDSQGLIYTLLVIFGELKVIILLIDLIEMCRKCLGDTFKKRNLIANINILTYSTIHPLITNFQNKISTMALEAKILASMSRGL